MSRIFRFGERVAGYDIPVLNEREIRAAAGMFFVLMFSAIAAVGRGNWLLLRFAVIFFFVDFSLRVFVSPRFSPSLILGRFIVRKQTPEYVGATQKKFAWIIGIVLATTMMVHLVWLNKHSPITVVICLVCLLFLFFETSFGICLGCKVYPLIYREKARYCPGEVCELKDRQEIQKTTLTQWLIVLAYIGFIVLTVVAMRGSFADKPEFVMGSRDPSSASSASSR